MNRIIFRAMAFALASILIINTGPVGSSVDMPEGYVEAVTEDDLELDAVPSSSHAVTERRAGEGDAVNQAVIVLAEKPHRALHDVR